MALSYNALATADGLDQYVAEKIKPLERKSPIWAMLRAHNRIKTGDKGGKTIRWHVTYRRQEPTPMIGATHRTNFPNWNFDTELALGWAGWEMGASIDYLTQTLFKNSEVDWGIDLKKRVDKMTEDFMEWLKKVFYLDVDTAAGGGFNGIPSFMSNTGSVMTNSLALLANDTYAGKSTAPGTLVDDWDSTDAGKAWPDGTGDAGYGALTPIMTKATAAHGGSTATWVGDNAQYALNYVSNAIDNLQSKELDAFIMTGKMYRELCNKLIGIQQLQVADPNSMLVKLGHKVKSYNGTEIVSDHYCTANHCYGVVWDGFELRTPQPQILSYSQDHDIETSDDLKKQMCLLQCRWHTPAWFCDIAAS